jgi:hypothetical protein
MLTFARIDLNSFVFYASSFALRALLPATIFFFSHSSAPLKSKSQIADLYILCQILSGLVIFGGLVSFAMSIRRGSHSNPRVTLAKYKLQLLANLLLVTPIAAAVSDSKMVLYYSMLISIYSSWLSLDIFYNYSRPDAKKNILSAASLLLALVLCTIKIALDQNFFGPEELLATLPVIFVAVNSAHAIGARWFSIKKFFLYTKVNSANFLLGYVTTVSLAISGFIISQKSGEALYVDFIKSYGLFSAFVILSNMISQKFLLDFNRISWSYVVSNIWRIVLLQSLLSTLIAFSYLVVFSAESRLEIPEILAVVSGSVMFSVVSISSQMILATRGSSVILALNIFWLVLLFALLLASPSSLAYVWLCFSLSFMVLFGLQFQFLRSICKSVTKSK